ncbi:MAG: sodium/proline symporter [Planctomycetaceae bacterium]|nr:sodium/proline symporter [Planctomycetaceae bacterium]
MEAYRSQIILGCVAAYFVLCILVGLWAMRRTHSSRDFFMAGRTLGFVVTAVAMFSSTMSGFGFVGGPGLIYQMGVSSIWIVVTASVGYCVSFYLLAKPLREMAIAQDSISLPDIVTYRYQSRSVGFLTAIAILLGVLGYLATQIIAMATVLQSLLVSMGGFETVPISVCAAVSTSLLVFYCVTGGIIASVYTDLVQGLIMMVASVLVFVAAVMAVDGGLSGMSQTIMNDDPAAMSPWGTRGAFGCLSWYFVFALGACGQPHVITKLMMTRDAKTARMTLPVSMFGYIITALLWISIGLAMRALVLQGVYPSLSTPDAAAPEFLQRYTHPILAGTVFAGLFAAIMSTADAFLNIGAAAVVHDIPKSLRFKPSPDSELSRARWATIGIAVLATVFGLYTGDLVALLGAFGWGTFAAALVPTVAIGISWKRATAGAACTAILASLLVNFSLKAFEIPIPLNLDTGAIALMVSLTLFLAISLFSKPNKHSLD